VTLEQNLLGLIPVAILHGTLQIRTMVSVQVLEDPVLVREASVHPLCVLSPGSFAVFAKGWRRSKGESQQKPQAELGGQLR
jgi:hypothetical protein